MRIRTKRRRMMILFKIFILFLCFICFYFFISSISEKKENDIKIISKPKIHVVESDIDAFDIWDNITDTAHFSYKSGTLIGINSHCNDGLYMKWRTNISNVISVNDALHQLLSIPLQTIYPAIAGYFHKIMCVYPWWRRTSDIYVHHLNYLGVMDESLCLCSSRNVKSFNDSTCRIINGGPETFVSANDCVSFGRQWEMLSMQEIYAQTGFEDTSNTDRTMLSINLDFFTIDNKDVIFPERETIELIEKHTNAILCPRHSDDETVMDAWFQEMLSLQGKVGVDHTKILDKYRLPLCTTKTKRIVSLKSLLKTLANVSDQQRSQLLHAGLCMGSKSSSQMDTNTQSVVVCSEPLNVDLSHLSHAAGEPEVLLQMEKLTQFLKQSVKEPSLITIVRSTRLGLVSPRSQALLERLLLESVTSLYQVNDTEVIYQRRMHTRVPG